jgi:hypothetical protein
MSVPFTWNLPQVAEHVAQGDLFQRYSRVEIGGPAVELMPEYAAAIPGVTVGHSAPDVLRRINPWATRTTLGCPRHCAFCGIGQGRIEPGGFAELHAFTVRPVICDNNFLAASDAHIEYVCEGLRNEWGWADFNQGLDARLMTAQRARAIAWIGRVWVRFAMDDMSAASMEAITAAIRYATEAGTPKSLVSVYALIGWFEAPGQAWERCKWIDQLGVVCHPMWFHALDALEANTVSEAQAACGWNDEERKGIMGWFYQHRRQGSLGRGVSSV